MKNDELQDFLEGLKVPEPNRERRSLHLQKARYAFLHERAIREEAYGRRRSGLAYFLMGAACTSLLLVFVFRNPALLPRGNDHQMALAGFRDEKILREMLSVFAEDLEAVVTNGGTPQVVLGDPRPISSKQPIFIEFRKDNHSYRVMSFSGESLKLMLGGREYKVDVLLSGDGKVILVGERGVWDGAGQRTLDGFQVRAQKMGNI